jgi:hypothetical protein
VPIAPDPVSVVPILTGLLQSGEKLVREGAAEGLGALARPHGRPSPP